ncbi:MAG: NACHT domain-containing protein [Desulfomonilaceae bacterium]
MGLDTFTISLVASIFANVMTSVTSWIIENCDDRSVKPDALKRSLQENASLNLIAQKVGPQLAKALKISRDDSAAFDRLPGFLASDEVNLIVRQILDIQNDDNCEQQELALITQFTDLLANWIGVPAQSAKELGEELFQGLYLGIETILLKAVEEGILQAHELRSAIRHRDLKTNLSLGFASLHERLDRLEALGKVDSEAIDRFEEDYRKHIADHYRDIMLLNLDPPQIYPLKEIYVAPTFRQLAVFRDENGEIYHEDEIVFTSFKQFISSINRTLVIGDPGVGKSTFCRYLCQGLANLDPDLNWHGKHPIPIRIELREYARVRKSKDLSFVAFMTNQTEARFSSSVPSRAFEVLLTSGRALVIFDGLDEIIDLAERHEIARRIEYFSRQYPQAPLLATSRRAGYELSQLNNRLFLTCFLREFDESQVVEYANKWFSLHSDLTGEAQQSMASAFIRDSETVQDLRYNPLLLAIMCFLYKYERYIPRNRPDVYRSCSEMLYKAWDTRRSVRPASALDRLFRLIIAFLAHRIIEDQTLQGGVPQKVLERLATEYLSAKRFEDVDEAAEVAREFIRYFVVRAGVLVPVGTSELGEQTFYFAHRTFLEYFAALYLVRVSLTPADLSSRLLPKVAKGQWNMVAQLAFHIMSDEKEDATEALLRLVSDYACSQAGAASERVFSFAAKCLEFLVPSPKAVQELTIACLDFCQPVWLSRVRGLRGVHPSGHRWEAHAETGICNALLNAASENQRALASAVENWIVKEIHPGDEDQAEIAFDLARNVTVYKDERDKRRFEKGGDKHHWLGIDERVASRCHVPLTKLAATNPRICVYLWHIHKIDLTSFIEWHGIENLFSDWDSITYSNLRQVSIADSLLSALILPQNLLSDLGMLINEIAEVGRALWKMSPPWIKDVRAAHGLYSSLFSSEESMKRSMELLWDSIQTNKDAFFGIIGMLAAMIEVDQDTKPKEILNSMKDKISISLGRVGPILLSRLDSDQTTLTEEHLQILDASGLAQEQKIFLDKWVQQDLNLVA